jgi:hypothetical protein
MKNYNPIFKQVFILLFVLSLFSCSVSAQHLDYKNLRDINKRISNFESYLDSNGDTIKVGDTLLILKPETDGNFTFVYYGSDMNGYKYLDRLVRDKKVTVSDIRVTRLNSETHVNMRCIQPGMVGAKFVIIWESAIKAGEAKINGGLSKDEALKLLEEKRKMLDLGLITQDEYDKLLEKLKPIILDKK